MVLPAGGLAVWGRASRLTGSGVLRAGLLIIPSPIGAVRPEAGAIRSQHRRDRRAISRHSVLQCCNDLEGRGGLHVGARPTSTHLSPCLSSATAASIAAAIFKIRATFAAGLRSRAAPVSSADIISAASTASAAWSVAVFTARPWCIQGERTPYGLPAIVLNVLERLSLRSTELTASKAPITISAAMRPYSMAVTPSGVFEEPFKTDHHRNAPLLTRRG